MGRIVQVIETNTGEVISQTAISENNNFIMLFRHKMSIIKEISEQNPSAFKLLWYLVEEMDKGNLIAVSQRTLSELLGQSVPTIARSIRFLKDKNVIETYLCGSQPIIAINAELVWTSHANGRKYARCQAEIVLSQSEQEKPRGRRIKTLETIGKVEVSGQLTLFPELDEASKGDRLTHPCVSVDT